MRLDATPQIDFAAVMERVRRMRSVSSAGDAVEAVEQTGAEVYLGHARFTAPNVVEVDGRQLRFRKAVLATGSDPFVPPIDEISAPRRSILKRAPVPDVWVAPLLLTEVGKPSA